MTVTIQIIFKSVASGSKILQRASFKLNGRKPQEVALIWWGQIKREMMVEDIEQVLCDGKDITEIIKVIDRMNYIKE